MTNVSLVPSVSRSSKLLTLAIELELTAITTPSADWLGAFVGMPRVPRARPATLSMCLENAPIQSAACHGVAEPGQSRWRSTIRTVLSRSRRRIDSRPPAGRLGECLHRLRTPTALAAGLVLAHDAVFASDSGLASLNSALARSGHGELWAIVSLVALVVGAFVVVGAMARLLRAEAAVHGWHSMPE